MSTQPPSEPPKGERIAKFLSRAGVASRREAERLIEAGLVTVNGARIDSPALNVTPADKVTVDGQPVGTPEPPRLWLYHKPLGLVTTAKDEKGRQTVFDALPEDMPRVMSVGRLDINSEGLLLLTNDGEIKRKLELPSTGWLRKYRVRIKGNPSEDDLTPLRRGIVIEGERFQPMSVSLDRHQGANAWLTVGLREGKNREIRRALEAVGLSVNRLIRVSYGPFRLAELKPGEVEEIRPKVLRDQLGLEAPAEPEAPARPQRKPGAKPGPRPGPGGAGKPGAKAGGRPGPKPDARQADKPDAGQRPGAKPGRGPGDRPGRGPIGGPAAKPGHKPGAAPGGKPGGRGRPSGGGSGRRG